MTTTLSIIARAVWPEPGDVDLPQLPGYVLSPFNPLVSIVVDRCLGMRFGASPVPAEEAGRVATIVVSAGGDTVSAEYVAQAVDTVGRVGPLFFFQSVPNSIAGHVAARWGLAGPVVCLCPTGDPLADGLAEAELLIGDGDAESAVIVLVESGRADVLSPAEAQIRVGGGAAAVLVTGGGK